MKTKAKKAGKGQRWGRQVASFWCKVCSQGIRAYWLTAGIVEKAEDYLYSSARDYCSMKGMLPIKFVDSSMVYNNGRF